jgi:hypothetical protein
MSIAERPIYVHVCNPVLDNSPRRPAASFRRWPPFAHWSYRLSQQMAVEISPSERLLCTRQQHHARYDDYGLGVDIRLMIEIRSQDRTMVNKRRAIVRQQAPVTSIGMWAPAFPTIVMSDVLWLRLADNTCCCIFTVLPTIRSKF